MVPDIKSLHIETTNICTLKCPSCSRTDFLNSPFGKYWKNQNLDYAALDKFLDIDLSDITLHLCGNYGDPLYYTELFNFVKTFKNRNAKLHITTNGSHKTKEWWTELCLLLDPSEDKITFSIDGTPDNFTQYRINGDWESIRVGIETCAEHKIFTEWKYIVFQYNMNAIDEAKELSRQLGMNYFSTVNSHRYDQIDTFKPDDLYINSKFFAQQDQVDEIEPACYNGQEHYISADGYYSPCCFVAEHRFYYKTEFGKNRKNYSIKNKTILEIIEDQNTIKFYETINDVKPNVCVFQCPKTNKNT